MSKSNLPEKIILGIFLVVLIVLITKYLGSPNPGPGNRINIIVPWGLIAIFISFYIFREYNRVKKAKRENRREYLNEPRQQLLDNAIKKNKNPPPDDQQGDT